MKNKNFTWIIKNEKGEMIKRYSYNKDMMVNAIYYGKLEDVVNSITLKEFKEMATLEIYNNSFDKVNHRPITKEQIEKMLEEVR